MVLTQLLELDIFFEALGRSVAGELCEVRDADSYGDSFEITPRDAVAVSGPDRSAAHSGPHGCRGLGQAPSVLTLAPDT